MKALNSLSISTMTLLLFRQTVTADNYCNPLFLSPPDPGNNTCATSLFPTSGSQNGGTIIKIDLGDCNEYQPNDDDVDIHCLFESMNDITSGKVQGFYDANIVECESPFSGQPQEVIVSYSVASRCNSSDSATFKVDEPFRYTGDRAGVLVYSTSTPTNPVFSPDSSPQGFPDSAPVFSPDSSPQGFPDSAPVFSPDSSPQGFPDSAPASFPSIDQMSINFGQKENTPSQVFFVGDTIGVKWSPEGLKASAYLQDQVEEHNITLKLKILAYDEQNDPPFSEIQSILLSMNDNETSFVLKDDLSLPMLRWATNTTKAALILVRVVASIFRNNTQYEDDPLERTLATASSKLIGILPKNSEGEIDVCPFLPNEVCGSNVMNPCPPSHDVALQDSRFSPDESCPWPSGNNTDCDRIDPFDESGDAIDPCPCASYHPVGVTGCVSDASTQCCYAGSGALIPSYDDGAGRPTCMSPTVQFESVDSFLYDKLPYLLCCGSNEQGDSCKSYLDAFPESDIDNDYEFPHTGGIVYGDPHFTNFGNINFNFNGHGEYKATTLKGKGKNSGKKIVIHSRFKPFKDRQRGTVHVGMAIEDPTFKDGTTNLIILLSNQTRLDFYEGNTPINFDLANLSLDRVTRIVSGAKITIPRESDRNVQKRFDANIVFNSGLMIKILEQENVFNPVITRPNGAWKVSGLLSGDFRLPNDESINFKINNEKTAYESERIFTDFGQKWRIGNKQDSLFTDVFQLAGQSFSTFDKPLFEPLYDASIVSSSARQLEGADTSFCSNYEDVFINKACIFDFKITGNKNLVKSTSDFAEEERVIRLKLLNVPLVVNNNGRVQRKISGINAEEKFTIKVSVCDSNTVTATLTRNDDDLFSLKGDGSLKFEVEFLGSTTVGTFKSHVTLTDGITPVLVTITVEVSSNPPPSKKSKRKISPKPSKRQPNTDTKQQKGSKVNKGCKVRKVTK